MSRDAVVRQKYALMQLQQYIMTNISEDIEWAPVTIPSLIREHPSEADQFDKYLDNRLKTDYPCHQQAVERAVALMSDAKLKCADADMKSGYHIAVTEERRKNPGAHKKRKYNKLS